MNHMKEYHLKIENDMLYVNQDEQIIEIKLDDIKDAIILKI